LQLLILFYFLLLDCAKENTQMFLWNLAVVFIRCSCKLQHSEIPPRCLHKVTNTCFSGNVAIPSYFLGIYKIVLVISNFNLQFTVMFQCIVDICVNTAQGSWRYTDYLHTYICLLVLGLLSYYCYCCYHHYYLCMYV
jgi:hypothetical protein